MASGSSAQGTMNQGDCGMVKTLKSIIKGEALTLIGNVNF
jgi:hypothetical protein